MTALFRKTFPKSLDELIRLEPEVDAFLARQNTPAPAAFRTRLALEEIVRNLIEHSPATRRIEVRIGVEADRVVLEIDDDGDYFDLRSAPAFDKSQPLEERRPGGMGIQLVRTLVREIDYQRIPSGNRLRLVIDQSPCRQ
jgi:anti-sigma regulatory factor (Ser/Thr protein kinase)